MKLLPFDLDKALKGARVVTRDGREVTQLHLFVTSRSIYPLIGVVDDLDEIQHWHRDGRFYLGNDDSLSRRLDLFLAAPVPSVRWVNFYAGGNHAFHFNSEELANRYEWVLLDEGHRDKAHRLYGRAIRVEIDPDGAA